MIAVRPINEILPLQHVHIPARDLSRGTLVFLHGWGGDSRSWLPLLEKLTSLFDVTLIDLPGFGANQHQPISDVAGVVEQLAATLPKKCILVGWSLGGMLATQLAARCPEKIDGLITLATNAKFVSCASWPSAMNAKTFLTFLQGFCCEPAKTLSRFSGLQVLGDSERKRVSLTLREAQPESLDSLVDAWRPSLALLAEMDNREALKQLRCPVLHILGANDSLVPLAAAPLLHTLNPLHKIITLERTGHALHISKPEAVAHAVTQFVKNEVGAPFSKQRVAQGFSLAAKCYDSHARLQQQVVSRLVEKSRRLILPDGVVADLGCGTGVGLKLLRGKFNRETIGLDIAQGMVETALEQVKGRNIAVIQGDIENLPFSNNTLALAFSSLVVQWCGDLSAFAREAYRVLQPGGSLCFSTLGPRTLFELRQSWKTINDRKHVNDFAPSSEVAKHLNDAGFSILDFNEDLTVMPYGSVLHLMRELKGIGAHNVNIERPLGLTGRHQLNALCRHYQAQYGEGDSIPATYQVYYYVASKPRQ